MKEEKERQISIELGFAPEDEEIKISVVDVAAWKIYGLGISKASVPRLGRRLILLGQKLSRI
ncbi:hypothetical protein HPT25_17985 [Bacillus sp. BRMEA1]|nr:hypothetical protein [Neobacillus endophyticus]